MDCRVSGILFSSNFDSGNLDRVERVSRNTDEFSSSSVSSNPKHERLRKRNNNINGNIFGNIAIADIRVDYEFRIWTRPDCAGTEYVNCNRTWFYFSVRGYNPGSTMRATIMNMNKQTKIYNQGFAPFFRVCSPSVTKSRWQRIRDKPFWELVNGQFLLTFIHRFQDPRGSITYFAFCYPWTYEEMQIQLNKLDAIFFCSKNNNIKVNTEKLCSKNNIMKFEQVDINGNLDSNCKNSSDPLSSFNIDKTNSVNATANYLTASSFSSSSTSPSSLPSLSSRPNCLSDNELFAKIYFHRELICYSLEGRRIELLTITDWSECTYIEEDRFDPLLFPDLNKPRPWKFTNKKIVLVSARVHPGETPSSHVFNGILEFLLRVNDQRACELRRNYVFKLIPMLNPDGVYRGHYRTDTRGVNLNRVYLKPDFLYYPSIYATKASVIYYHTNYGTLKSYAPFLDDIFKQKLITTTNSTTTSSMNRHTENATTVLNSDYDKLSPNHIFLPMENIKQSKGEIQSDYDIQELIPDNYSKEESNTTTTQHESKEESHSSHINNHQPTMYEHQLNDQNVCLQKSSNTVLLSPTMSLTPSKTDNLTKKNLSHKYSLSSDQMNNTSNSMQINENAFTVHRINLPVDDSNKNLTTNPNNADLRNVFNYRHTMTGTDKLSLRRSSQLNSSISIATPLYLAELSKDSPKHVQHSKSAKVLMTLNTDVSKKTSECCQTGRIKTLTSETSNLMPSVTKLTTPTSNCSVVNDSSLDNQQSKAFNNHHKCWVVEQTTFKQTSHTSFYERNKRYSTLKVGYLPYFLMKWNIPHKNTLTGKHSANFSFDNFDTVNTRNKLNNEQIINVNFKRNTIEDNITPVDSMYSHKKCKSYLNHGIVKKSKVNVISQNYSTYNEVQMTSDDDTMTHFVPLKDTEEYIRNLNHDTNNTIEKNEVIMESMNHIIKNNNNEEDSTLNEIVKHLDVEKSCSFNSSHSILGNEGSDLGADDNMDDADEDLSINPQYVHILGSIETLVRNEKNKAIRKNETIHATDSVNMTDNDLSMNELDRIHVLKEQLQQLRKASHLSDANYLRFNNNDDSNVAFYFDLHGHCSKRGCFLYGNWLETEENMVDNVLYALLVGVNSIYFDFDSCNFSIRNMYQRDCKSNSTKEGAGRVALWKHLGLTHCYTVECNYNSGPLPSRLSRFISSALPNDSECFTPVGAFYGPHWSDIVNTASSHSLNSSINSYTNTGHNAHNGNKTLMGVPRYTPAHYEDVGRALMIAILDFNQINPWPKIASLGGSTAKSDIGIPTLWSSLPEFLNIKTLREWARKYIRGIAPTNVMNKPSVTQNTEYFTLKDQDLCRSQINNKSLINTNEHLEELINMSSTCSESVQISTDKKVTNSVKTQSECIHHFSHSNSVRHDSKPNKYDQNIHQLPAESLNSSNLNSSLHLTNNEELFTNHHEDQLISSKSHSDYLTCDHTAIDKTLLDYDNEYDEMMMLKVNDDHNNVNNQLNYHKVKNDKLLKT
ncbi:Cytosolic carboxypeptidase-like protein 5 [Schistosoma japonicum]|nr:Cytosolic carboxypeptidase-like protein 5 [Schistosoma japonicum]